MKYPGLTVVLWEDGVYTTYAGLDAIVFEDEWMDIEIMERAFCLLPAALNAFYASVLQGKVAFYDGVLQRGFTNENTMPNV